MYPAYRQLRIYDQFYIFGGKFTSNLKSRLFRGLHILHLWPIPIFRGSMVNGMKLSGEGGSVNLIVVKDWMDGFPGILSLVEEKGLS